ncbi:MAG TPA: alpha/beta hydrolase [Symbiobacteriaceae bacterium]|nr:alpha/beta hydrolase [Symbiobacteriaceae bacterium]
MFYRRTPPIPGNGSIAELKTVEINGTKQTLLLRGESRNNPIVLFLHGGPGSAQISFARQWLKELEKDFVVVNWDQRGAGLSYSGQIPKESMTIAQFIEDTRVVSELLLAWFGQEKLFLVGHSWGTVLGTLTAARYPHLFHAYIGMGQVAAMADNEAVSYRFTLETAKQRGLSKAVKELERIGPPPYGIRQIGVQRKWLRQFGGFMRQGSLTQMVLRSMLASTEYTLADFVRYTQGAAFTLNHMWDEVMTVNLPVQVPRLEMPVYYILGRHDMNTPSELAVAYFNQLSAPAKALFWAENSGHVIPGEEPDAVVRVMRKVLQDHHATDVKEA